MPTVIQPGFVQTQSPYGEVDTSIARAVSEGFDLGYNRRGNEKVDKFKTVNDIIAKTFPDELGGFTAAYRSGNPQQAAAADQALGLYLNSVEGITGKRLRPEEREAIKGAFVNGQLTTKQLLANAQSQVMSPGGQEQGQGVPVQGPMQNAQGPATPVAATGPVGPIASVPAQPRNIETMQPQGQGAVMPQGAQEPVAQGAPAPTPPMMPSTLRAPSQYAGVAVQAAPASSLSPNPYMERGFAAVGGNSPQGTYQGKTYTPDQQEANRQKVLEVLSFGMYKSPARKAAEAEKARSEALNSKGEEAKKPGPFQPGADTSGESFTTVAKSLTPEQLSLVQNEVSRETPEGGRAIPTGTGSEIALDKRELTNVARAVKGTSTLMDTLMKARNADELGRKTYSVTRALETAAALVPGSKEMDREWAAGTVKAIINASPQELSALGLNEEAKIALQNDANRIAAEQNSINLFSVMKRNAIDLTQLETSKRIAELQYFSSAAAATGTQAGLLTKAQADIAVELLKAASAANPGKKMTGVEYAKWYRDAGFNTFADFISGSFGGEGSIYQPAQGLPFFGTPEKFRPPTASETTAAGATPGATYGQMASGYLGGGAPTGGMTSSKTSQKAVAKGSGIDQFFNEGGVQGAYQANADKMYQDWQAFLASQQQ